MPRPEPATDVAGSAGPVQQELLRLLTAGSVDDGKSTLIGRLLYDSNSLYEDQVEAVERDSRQRGHAGGALDLSLLTDGLRAEREQGITIDVAYRYFTTPRRKFIIADTPGHEQYTRNMVTGASACDLAIILVDARQGVLTQSRRHSYLAALLGIRHLVVAINKMDLVDYRQDVFDRIEADYNRFAARLGVSDLVFIPLSALNGDNVVRSGPHMPWYEGPPLLSYLETVHIGGDRNLMDFRFPVQLVLRPDSSFRGLAGTVASGIVRRGDEVLVLPSHQRSRIQRLCTFDGDLEEAQAGTAVTVVLADNVDAGRGDMLVHPSNQPLSDRDFLATVVWMDQKPMRQGSSYLLKHSTNTVSATISDIMYRIDVNTVENLPPENLELNDIGCAHVSVGRPIFYDPYRVNRSTGSFILIDRQSHATAGAGMILSRHSKDPQPASVVAEGHSEISPAMRRAKLAYEPVVVWFTGLPNSGKSSIAYRVERLLFDLGCMVYTVGATTMRAGLSADLTFDADDRSENVRRLGEVAVILADAGVIALCVAISPYRTDRERVRHHVGEHRFLEIYCDAPVEVCEPRDTRGLYAKARSGEIKAFTGISAPYEPPDRPDLRLRIDSAPVDDLTGQVVALLRQRGSLPP